MISQDSNSAQIEIANIVADLLTNVFNSTDRNPANMWSEHKLIREKLDRIATLQATLSNTDSNIATKRGEGALAEFLAWCDRKGIVRDGVEVDEDPKLGYQLIATRDMVEGEIVITVPRRAIFCVDQAKKLPGLRKLFVRDHMLSQMDNVGLALGLCALQLKDDSSWLPYLNVLPSSFDCPLYYSLEDLEGLRPSPTFDDALYHYRTIARQFCYYLALVNESHNFNKQKKEERKGREPPSLYDGPFTLGNFTFGLYKWAVCSVTTRINKVPSEYETVGENSKLIPSLIPLLDFANHEFNNNTQFTPGYCDTEDVAALPINKPTKKGQPITIQYGLRTTGEFFLHNAFSPPINPYNKYKLRIGLPKTDQYIDHRVAQMCKLGYSNMNTVYSFNVFIPAKDGDVPFDESLIRFARVFMSNPPTDEIVDSDESLKKGLQFLDTRLSLLLRAYSNKNLEGDSNTSILLRQEKEILEKALNYIQNYKK